MDAARCGHAGIVQALLACGADSNIQDEVTSKPGCDIMPCICSSMSVDIKPRTSH